MALTSRVRTRPAIDVAAGGSTRQRATAPPPAPAPFPPPRTTTLAANGPPLRHRSATIGRAPSPEVEALQPDASAPCPAQPTTTYSPARTGGATAAPTATTRENAA